MSRIFKSQSVRVDENNRVNIKNQIEIKEVEKPNHIHASEKEVEVDEAPSKEEANEIAKQIIESAAIKAKSIIESAESEAKVIIEEAKDVAYKEVEKIKDDAYKAGYEDGLNKGKEVAESTIRDAEAVKEEAVQYREELIAQIEPNIIELIAQLLKELLSAEIEINPEVISVIVKKGLSNVPLTGDITVRVSKEDYEEAVKLKDEILASLNANASLSFVEDATIKKSDCIIETGFGSINCGLNTQYEEVKKNLYYILRNR